jgi:hypothetical protein
VSVSEITEQFANPADRIEAIFGLRQESPRGASCLIKEYLRSEHSVSAKPDGPEARPDYALRQRGSAVTAKVDAATPGERLFCRVAQWPFVKVGASEITA